jgi:hypothetical protein
MTLQTTFGMLKQIFSYQIPLFYYLTLFTLLQLSVAKLIHVDAS